MFTNVFKFAVADPLFSSWSKFTECQTFTTERLCGPGMQSRTRSVILYDDERPTKPAEDSDVYELRPCFKACDPDDPNCEFSIGTTLFIIQY